MSREEPEIRPGPRYCPRCKGRLDTEGDETLCRDCGERLVPAGYCAICEDHWPLEVGSACPKHDVPLEEEGPRGGDEREFGDRSRWVVLATYPDALKAEAPRIRLEAEGIPTSLDGERMGSQSMYTVATGGVKLRVPEAVADDARVLLSQSWTPLPLVDDLDDAWDELGPEPGSRRRAVMKGLIVFLLIAPFLMTLLSFCFAPRGD